MSDSGCPGKQCVQLWSSQGSPMGVPKHEMCAHYSLHLRTKTKPSGEGVIVAVQRDNCANGRRGTKADATKSAFLQATRPRLVLRVEGGVQGYILMWSRDGVGWGGTWYLILSTKYLILIMIIFHSMTSPFDRVQTTLSKSWIFRVIGLFENDRGHAEISSCICCGGAGSW